jgi:hypothetical protein
MAVADKRGQFVRVPDFLLKAVDVNVIVAHAVHFCKVHFILL